MRFPFRFVPLYRALALPFGVTPQTAVVEVVGGRLTARFGPWRVSTPLANVAGCEESSSFSTWKTAGPAHLSLVDHGLTFATNPDRALCVCFRAPVRGIDPFGLVRHPGLTLTVEDVAGLRAAIEEGVTGASGTPERLDQVVRPDVSPLRTAAATAARWTRWLPGAALATVRYASNRNSVEREFVDAGALDEAAEPADPSRVQDLATGVGAVFDRSYTVRIAGAGCEPKDLLDLVAADLNAAAPAEIAAFEKLDGVRGDVRPGDEYVVRMPGPWNGPVRVVERTPTSFRFETLRGHMEAGEIEFRTGWAEGGAPPAHGGDDLEFSIRSRARSGGRLFHVIYERVPVAREMQLHVWAHFCRRVAALAGGRVEGPVKVQTVRHGS